ncbi:hypothetical protein [Escherichia coli]|uniref:hypothetical protein n=1 Tax=Escherichia coli TaxID=562 RepID=UPI00388E3C10
MFADVMVRVIGVSYFTSVLPEHRLGAGGFKSSPAVTAPAHRPEHHRDAGYIGITLSSARRIVQQHALIIHWTFNRPFFADGIDHTQQLRGLQVAPLRGYAPTAAFTHSSCSITIKPPEAVLHKRFHQRPITTT